MSNPSKARGTAAETALLRWCGENGKDARRNPPAGRYDVGDLTVFLEDFDVCVEVKSWKDQAAAMRAGIAELDAEMHNAGTTHGVLVLKRKGTTDPGEWYAIRKVKNDPELAS